MNNVIFRLAKTSLFLCLRTEVQGGLSRLLQLLVLSCQEEAGQGLVGLQYISAREGTHFREHGMQLLEREEGREWCGVERGEGGV